ncbi:WD40-repeat-containing domain protein [Xylariales sp. AK1849]|nr:WD40-repeat-containing domain protein [Xylariales sp. AK1849]
MSSTSPYGHPLTRGSKGAGHLQREFVLNPITALAFFTSSINGQLYLLAGEDNRINIYDVEKSEFLGEITVFQAQSIHGIGINPSDAIQGRVLIWGGYSVAVLPVQAVETIISGDAEEMIRGRHVVEVKAPDWILDGVLSLYETNKLVLLTAHNELIDAFYNEVRESVEFEDINSPSRPILYSGTLLWESRECVLVAAGTVFGEILVWKYHARSQKRHLSCEVLFIFSGHEGSIFGVHISPEIHLETGESLRLLASCSDDRTIRVWDITEAHDLSRNAQHDYQRRIMAARQTGFGDSVVATMPYETQARCLAVEMGHVSRIWQVRFPSKQPLIGESSGVEVWSFGEDATAQKWTLSLKPLLSPPKNTENQVRDVASIKTVGHLKNEDIFANHSGKNVWSHAMIYKHTNDLLIVTGGSDGQLSLVGTSYRIATERTFNNIPAPPVAALSTSNSSESNKKSKVKIAKERFNRYAFLTDGHLLAVTNRGRFFIGGSDADCCWKELSLPEEISRTLFSYSVIRSSSIESVAFVGSAGGEVFIYRGVDSSTLEPLTKVHGKIADIFVLSDATRKAPMLLLVTILGTQAAVLLEIDFTGHIIETTEREVRLDKGFTVTSVALHAEYMILGSRNGFISILRSVDNQAYSPNLTVEVKINDAITSLTMLPPEADGGTTCFLATCRDGKYRIYDFVRLNEHIAVSLLHETSPPFGPLIEGAWFTNNQDGTMDLMLYGFRSKYFVVWNETQRREITAVECGGGHRTFAYTPLRDCAEAFRFAYTKASQLCFFSQTHAPHRTLKSGGHGREAKAVSSSGKLVATAAEDTAIRIWRYDSHEDQKTRGLRCLAVIERHTAGIQTLRWHKQSHLFSSAGNEEFFVWRINRLNSLYQGLAVKCEAVFPDRTEDGDLRIMDFDIHCLKETSDNDPRFYISMALSNSTLQTYIYSADNGFQLLVRGSYTGACLTQLRHLHVDNATIQTLTTATDGYIATWEAEVPTGAQTSIHGSVRVTKLHQSTIKALDIRQLDFSTGTSYLVVTGGDDNALGVMHFHKDRASNHYAVKSKSVVRSAHAAAVTGVAISKFSADGREAIVVSSSNDQRVKKWKILDWQSGNVRVSLLDNGYSSVADAGDLEALEGGKVMIGGVGLEVWDVGG